MKNVRINANRTIHFASGPAPMIIGKGQINITPPKLIGSPEERAEIINKTTPVKIMKKPTKNKIRNFRYVCSSFSELFS